jgi:predicted flap endonuclease-1-like 5' DNA nuclease
MTYLLWQIVWCLVGTALLFLVFGWLIRGWFGQKDKGNLKVESERAAWLGGQIRTLGQKVSDRDKAIEEGNALLTQLRAQLAERQNQLTDRDTKLTAAVAEIVMLKTQVAELTPKLAFAASAGAEVVALKAQVAQLEPEISKLQTSSAEVSNLRSQLAAAIEEARARGAEPGPLMADRDARVSAAAEEAANLRSRIADLEGELAITQAAESEGMFHTVTEENARLKEQIGELEPQISAREIQLRDWELRYTKAIAEKDSELAACRNRVTQLQQTKPAVHDIPPEFERDDLKLIFGIGPVLEKRLNELGVRFFREIAAWTKDDILRFESHLKEFPRRIERDNWVEGAREEHFKKYGQSAQA